MSDKHAHIIYYNYLKPDGSGMSVGGIQTYLANLIPVLEKCGYGVSVYQRSYCDFHKNMGSYDVYGVGYKDNYGVQVARALLDAALPHIDMSNDLLVYGCETCMSRSVSCKTIAIQHGISWDVPLDKRFSRLRYLRSYVGKSLNAWKTIRRVGKVDRLVCVDNNFINWHRAIVPYPEVRHIFIPNFTAIPTTQPLKQHDGINIIFARRFFVHRGTRLFANVIERLLKEHQNINVTIAGTGPDADYMHKKLDSFNNVQFTTFNSQDSLRIHEDKDVAVVPTVGSEGTSLSLLEAMASGCAVICTNVGGMTNIVLDGYNGLMINPEEVGLYKALTSLIVDSSLRTKLQTNAYNCAKEAFSLQRWQDAWKEVIDNVAVTK